MRTRWIYWIDQCIAQTGLRWLWDRISDSRIWNWWWRMFWAINDETVAEIQEQAISGCTCAKTSAIADLDLSILRTSDLFAWKASRGSVDSLGFNDIVKCLNINYLQLYSLIKLQCATLICSRSFALKTGFQAGFITHYYDLDQNTSKVRVDRQNALIVIGFLKHRILLTYSNCCIPLDRATENEEKDN